MQISNTRTLDALYSNHIWQCIYSRLDILSADYNDKCVARPYLIQITDVYSQCIMGIYLSIEEPSSQAFALALRHAILPKQYGNEYALDYQWQTFGVPQLIITDKSKYFRSKYLQQIAKKLDFKWLHIDHPRTMRAREENFFLSINREIFSNSSGDSDSYSQRSQNIGENERYLTLQELNLLLVNYIVNNCNQKVDNVIQNQTRFKRWETGLPALPNIVDEQDLDIDISN